jgi:hypothetical protein
MLKTPGVVKKQEPASLPVLGMRENMVVSVESEIEQYANTHAIPIESAFGHLPSMSPEQARRFAPIFIPCSFITTSTFTGLKHNTTFRDVLKLTHVVVGLLNIVQSSCHKQVTFCLIDWQESLTFPIRICNNLWLSRLCRERGYLPRKFPQGLTFGARGGSHGVSFKALKPNEDHPMTREDIILHRYGVNVRCKTMGQSIGSMVSAQG